MKINPAPAQTSFEDLLPITWQISIPLLSSSLIIKQLLIVFLIPTSCLLIFTLGLAWFEGQLTLELAGNYLLILTLILAGLLMLAIVSILILYGNQYQVQFTVNERGVQSATVGKTKRKNAIINTLLALSGKPGVAGAGLLAASRQSELIQWRSISHYKTNPDQLEIHLCQEKRTLMLVKCTPDNYTKVLRWVRYTTDAYHA